MLGIHKVYSSSQSDIDNMEQPRPYHMKELDDSEDEVSGPSSRPTNNNNNRKDNNNNNSNNNSSSGGNTIRNSSPNRNLNDREDHRKQGYRAGSNANATNRLHQHISKENNNYSNNNNSNNNKNLQRFPSEIEEIQLEPHNKGKRPVITQKVNSDGSMFSLMDINSDTYDGAESDSNTNSPISNNNNSSNNLRYSSNSLHAVSGSSEDLNEEPPRPIANVRQTLTKMNGVNMSANATSSTTSSSSVTESKETPKCPSSAAAAGGGGGSGTGTGKRGMPTSAPPKRAVESLTQVEAVINNTTDGTTSSGKRLTIDELLYRKKINAAVATADSKGSDDRVRSGSKNLDDSDEEELDFKVKCSQ